MAMKPLPELQWLPSRRIPLRMLALVAAGMMVGAVLLYWKVRLDLRLAQRQQQLERVIELSAQAAPRRKTPLPTLSPAAAHQLSRQMALLNRDWAQLSKRLAPQADEARLLGMDVDPASGSVHVTGRADSATMANAYARSLSKQTDALRQVRLLGLERQADGIRFEISAQWIE